VSVSASIHEGKTSYFHYFLCGGDWDTYVKFSVEEWDSNEGIAFIRVTNESAIQDYRLSIPEWSIVNSGGVVIGRWPYCPIWFDTSEFEEGTVIDDPNSWFCNFTVENVYTGRCELVYIGPFVDDYQIIEHLLYDTDYNRIDQYDYSTKHVSNVVHTVRLSYYPSSYSFTHAEAQFQAAMTPILLAGIAIELILIVFFVARRLRQY
jgi:hypothetical protein